MVKKQAKKSGGKFYVTATIMMRSKALNSAAANKLKAQIKRKSPKAQVTISKA